MFKIGDILTKESYAAGAVWCNQNNATIAKQGADYVIVAIPEPTTAEKAAARIAELKQYLAATDWYSARYVDSGAEIPQEVKAKRAAARAEINELEASYE